jgi:hypothetical protein
MQTVVRLEYQHFLSQTSIHKIKPRLGDVMDICAIEQAASAEPGARRAWVGAILALLERRPSRVGRLYLEAMPDRVKRDLGFLDGREPRYEDDRMR